MCPEPHRRRRSTMNPENEQAELVAEDLIEEVSIDGMCGVY
ncbi:mycofactocin precursor MftA [Nocardioides ginsengisoli]|uniref:Mycofactocin MftA n=1 Tax=Nocardioides ginsengisoli TaxID=363868 RepID=A0ABW3W6G9_9ACTN